MKKALSRTLEVWSQLSSWTGLAAVYGLAVISTPFGTHTFELPLLMVFWAVMIVGTFGIGTFVGSFFLTLVPARPNAGHFLMISVATGWVVGHLVFVLDAAMRGWSQMLDSFSHEKGMLVVLFSIIMSGAAFLIDATLRLFGDPTTPRILTRIGAPEDDRLVSISGDGRYVEVVTSSGRFRVLMRLCDAVEGAAPVEGVMVHRSHWVALDQVAGRQPVDGRDVLVLVDGRQVPISRSGAASLDLAGYFEDEVAE